MPAVLVIIGEIEIEVDCLETNTATEIINALPFDSTVETWGCEIYFSTPVQVEKEPDAKDIITAGEIAFWVEGNCIVIGYGPTPISEGNEIRLAAKTNIWAKSRQDLSILSTIKPGETVSLRLLD